jgi:hypothetical protein
MPGYLRDTTTTTGLKVTARLLEGIYHTGKCAADAVMKSLTLERHTVCLQWNYTIARACRMLLLRECVHSIGKYIFTNPLGNGSP